MIKELIIVLGLGALLGVFFVSPANAHPGRTDSDGGHYCRTNCDDWDEEWDEWHSHGTYSAPPTAWKCTIGDKVFYSKDEASRYWYGLVHEAVNKHYQRLLNRDATPDELVKYDDTSSFNDCNGNLFGAGMAGVDIVNTDEYKALHKKVEVESVAAQELVSESESVPDNDYSWLWWLTGGGAYLGYLYYVSKN